MRKRLFDFRISQTIQSARRGITVTNDYNKKYLCETDESEVLRYGF